MNLEGKLGNIFSSLWANWPSPFYPVLNWVCARQFVRLISRDRGITQTFPSEFIFSYLGVVVWGESDLLGTKYFLDRLQARSQIITPTCFYLVLGVNLLLSVSCPKLRRSSKVN